MDFLKKDVRDYFFNQYPDIYSKVEDLPPAKYNKGSVVTNNTYIENCIVESRDTIRANTKYVGDKEDIRIVIEKNDRYAL